MVKTKKKIIEYEYNDNLIIQYDKDDFMATKLNDDDDIITKDCKTLRDAKYWLDNN